MAPDRSLFGTTLLGTTRWGVCRGLVGAAGMALVVAGSGVVSAPGASAAVKPAVPVGGLASVLQTQVGSLWGDLTADKVAKEGGGKNTPTADPGSLYTIETAIGARSVWTQTDASRRQLTGQGVGVALLDSGVNAVPGLDGAGKVVYGPDLSVESNGPLTNQDTFGHGTHLAGIIGAHDPAALTGSSVNKLSPTTQLGVAPDATIEALKLGNTDGSTDVSQVIAALNWVTEHQTLADGTRVRVVNLSYGTDSLQAYESDPLAAAAENAWRHGLVVVVSGGNEGAAAGRLTDPAMDPYVLSVGASDGGDTVSGWSKPSVASFSSSGTVQRHVDILAPGRSIVSLRDPGSFVDVNHPEGLVDGDTSGRLFRGSGTSQAAAVVSGAVALMLQAYPDLTPDQVKYLLTHNATPVNASPVYAGAGQINVAAALNSLKQVGGPANKLLFPSWLYTQTWAVSTGQGSLDAARGGVGLVDADGVPLAGEIDAQGVAWDPAAWWAAASTLTSWQGGSWNGSVWTGTGWSPAGSGYAAARWSAARWSAARWSDAQWDAARWSAARWSAARWSAARWSDAQWDAARWSGAAWN